MDGFHLNSLRLIILIIIIMDNRSELEQLPLLSTMVVFPIH